MPIKSSFDLRHLESIMDSGSPNQAKGACFFRAIALVLDLGGSELCIATLPGVTEKEFRADPRKSPTPFIHSWVEWTGKVIAPTDLERNDYVLGWHDRTDYYDLNEVGCVKRMDRGLVVKLAAENGWDRHFLKRDPLVRPIVPVLLAAAGVSFEESARGGIVPLGTRMPDYAFLPPQSSPFPISSKP